MAVRVADIAFAAIGHRPQGLGDGDGFAFHVFIKRAIIASVNLRWMEEPCIPMPSLEMILFAGSLV